MNPSRAIGLRHLHLVDASRPDSSSSHRELRVSVFYPAIADPTIPAAKLVTLLEPSIAAVAAKLAEQAGLSTADLAQLKTLTLQAQLDLTPEYANQAHPVLLYYPGSMSHRLSNAAVCEKLAADGFVVFCLDAPRDAPVVVYPNGRAVFGPMEDTEDYIWPRIADIHFVLDQLQAFNASGPFADLLDLANVGAFGHSRGGYLSTIAAVEDPRIRAAANLDGLLWGFWSADDTGLSALPAFFPPKARANRTPLLRLKGDQGSTEKALAGFEREAADLGGDFIGIALHGWSHGDFATTPALCGAPGKIAANLWAETPSERVHTLHGLLTAFFSATLITYSEPISLFISSRPGMDRFTRPSTEK